MCCGPTWKATFLTHTLYHEYTHQVTHLNAAFLPTWFSEGYAEFFGNSRIVGRRVSIGWAPEGDLAFLQQTRLLPLEVLFRVDHKSPYYNETQESERVLRGILGADPHAFHVGRSFATPIAWAPTCKT